jgi:hypothetical protein
VSRIEDSRLSKGIAGDNGRLNINTPGLREGSQKAGAWLFQESGRPRISAWYEKWVSANLEHAKRPGARNGPLTAITEARSMAKATLLVIGSSLLLLADAWIVCAQTAAPSAGKNQDREIVRYEAEEGLPKDKAGEKRRDYAVLEAALNDLASPKNPEYKYRMKNVGPGKEIVLNVKTEVANRFTALFLGLDRPNGNIDGEDVRSIPVDIQEDFKRRSNRESGSLADFKPASPKIIVENLDEMRRDFKSILDDGLNAIRKKYPNAWGYVWAYAPGYSKDGNSAVVVFIEPGGPHGGDWVYLLNKKGKRWEVAWRHAHNYK